MFCNEGVVLMEKNDAQIGLRVTDTFKNRLIAQAEKEHRSVSNLIVKVLTEYLDKQEEDAE